MPKNAWGEEVEVVGSDPWEVPEEERLEHDDPDAPDANALDDETGDDLEGWTPAQGEGGFTVDVGDGSEAGSG